MQETLVGEWGKETEKGGQPIMGMLSSQLALRNWRLIPLGKLGKSENSASPSIWVKDQVVWWCYQSTVDGYFCKVQYKCHSNAKLL